jgi:hypothetical protein
MHYLILAIVQTVLFCTLAHAAPTVFLLDGTVAVGNAVWTENSSVYLSVSNEIYEYGPDEVNLEETLKFNKLGRYQVATPEGRGTNAGNTGNRSRRTQSRPVSRAAAQPEGGAASVHEGGRPVVTSEYAPPEGSNPDARDTSPEALRFIGQFRDAIKSGNVAALTGLVNWLGASADTRLSVEFALKECMVQNIQDIYIGPVPAGTPLEYKLRGKTYRPNLTPCGYLHVMYAPGPKGQKVMITSSGFMVGRSGSRIMIATAAEF